MSHKRRLNQLEKQLNGVLDDDPLPSHISRVQYWKDVLQDRREDPGKFRFNVEKSDKICKLLALKDLDREIPEDLQKALEEEISTYSKLFEYDRETIRQEIIKEMRWIPANWDFSKIMDQLHDDENKTFDS